jgi:hypothetical protein
MGVCSSPLVAWGLHIDPGGWWLMVNFLRITNVEEEMEIIAGLKRSASSADEVSWVSDNLKNRSARPGQAPTNAAWVFLTIAVTVDENGKDGREKFMHGPYTKLRARKSDAEDAVSQRQQLKNAKLLDSFDDVIVCVECRSRMTPTGESLAD